MNVNPMSILIAFTWNTSHLLLNSFDLKDLTGRFEVDLKSISDHLSISTNPNPLLKHANEFGANLAFVTSRSNSSDTNLP